MHEFLSQQFGISTILFFNFVFLYQMPLWNHQWCKYLSLLFTSIKCSINGFIVYTQFSLPLLYIKQLWCFFLFLTICMILSKIFVRCPIRLIVQCWSHSLLYIVLYIKDNYTGTRNIHKHSSILSWGRTCDPDSQSEKNLTL